MIRRPPRSTLFPYTTLFQSNLRKCEMLLTGAAKDEEIGVFAKEIDETPGPGGKLHPVLEDRKSTRLNSSHANISYAVFCLKKKKTSPPNQTPKSRQHTQPTA